MLHKTLSTTDWQQSPLVFQLGNIGSEIERTIRWKQKNKQVAENAFLRALELIACTEENHALTSPQRKEIARMRELLIDWFYGENIYGSTDILWQKYFIAFAIAARSNTHTS